MATGHALWQKLNSERPKEYIRVSNRQFPDILCKCIHVMELWHTLQVTWKRPIPPKSNHHGPCRKPQHASSKRTLPSSTEVHPRCCFQKPLDYILLLQTNSEKIPKLKHRNFCYFHLKQDSSGDFSASSILFSVKKCRAVFIKAALKAEPSSGNSDALSTPVLVGVKTLNVTFNLSSFKRGLRKPRVERLKQTFQGSQFPTQTVLYRGKLKVAVPKDEHHISIRNCRARHIDFRSWEMIRKRWA